MQEVTFHLRTVTPLFMAGADQSIAELRAPSFRGEMRYWYRAMVGGLLEPLSDALKTLKDAESDVFGATDSGSPVQIRILDSPAPSAPILREGTGRDYLPWSVLQSRPCFSRGTQFRLRLSIHSFEDERKAQGALKQAVSAFWLLTQLGGVGSRARRCAGSLAVTRWTGDTFGLPFDIPATAPDLQRILKQGIAKSRELYDSSRTASAHYASYDILAPETCKIWILLNNGNPWKDADQALHDIGANLQSYRRDIRNLQERKIFGARGNRRSRPISITGPGHGVNRIASPLHLRLSALKTGKGWQYVGVATLFKTRWKDMSPQDFKLYDHIEKWQRAKFPTALEVEL